MAVLDNDTITALATPPGKGGVGIIRISGPKARHIGESLTRQTLRPRYAHYGAFYQQAGSPPTDLVLDQGICLYFPNPHSFTGEDVVELQGHGGPVIMDLLLREAIHLGARQARPGEFSERAFLNDKLDLAQAEAIADLIDSTSEQAARSALRSLQGEFSREIHHLVEQVIALRIYVEAAIDFPEEEIDFLADGHVAKALQSLIEQLQQVFSKARQGAVLRDGMTVVIAGRPNAGKSSLLNALAGYEAAIVTDIAGTTRDVLKEHIQIDGMPLHIIDTAGLRDSADLVEQEGIRRARMEIEKADCILLVVDSQSQDSDSPLNTGLEASLPDHIPRVIVRNKCDLSQESPGECQVQGRQVITLSARHGLGLDLLRQHLKQRMGYNSNETGLYAARRRHLEALTQAADALATGQQQLLSHGAGELLAEDLRRCQQNLNEITGEFSSDDLLGRIFGSFCIGK